MSTSQEWAQYLLRLQRTHPERLRVSGYVREQPSPKQAAALLLPHRCVLFGGAAGGGKSSWLLMEAVRYADQPGAALVVRRESVNLTQPGALIPRSHEWFGGTDAHWRGDEKTWTFPSGWQLKFGHMEHEDDKHNYQSAEYDVVCYEELTEFTETQFRYLFSRQRRRKGSTIPLRTCAGTNPGGGGHEWVASCWGLGDYETPAEPEWAFLPSFLEDNPGLDHESYRESLSFLPEFERDKLLHGNWKARPKGNLFKVDRIRFCDESEVPTGGGDARFWDLASTEEDPPGQKSDATAGARGTIADNVLYVRDLQHARKGPGGVQTLIGDTAAGDGTGCRVVIEQEPGSSGVNNTFTYQNLVLPGFAVEGRPASGAKRSRWTPFEAAIEQKRVVFVRAPWNRRALGELGALTTDEKQDAKNNLHDDIVDALAGLYTHLQSAVAPRVWRPGRKPAPQPPGLILPPIGEPGKVGR